MTSSELRKAIPARLHYWGTYYYLRWEPTHNHKYIRISYVDDYGETLGIDGVWFYAETERHYAAYTLVNIILNHAEIVLDDLFYKNPEYYNVTVNTLYENMIILHNFCTEYPTEEFAGYEKRDMVSIY